MLVLLYSFLHFKGGSPIKGSVVKLQDERWYFLYPLGQFQVQL